MRIEELCEELITSMEKANEQREDREIIYVEDLPVKTKINDNLFKKQTRYCCKKCNIIDTYFKGNEMVCKNCGAEIKESDLK